MNADITLHSATVQEIQLELIRRTKFNDFDGVQVCELLHRHRHLWRAVLFDRPGVPNYNKPGQLLTGGLIKLRDLEHNLWNVDTLFVYTKTIDGARVGRRVRRRVSGSDAARLLRIRKRWIGHSEPAERPTAF